MTKNPELIDRRDMLSLSLAAAVAASLPRYGYATDAGTPAAQPLAATLAAFAEEILQLVPETATGLGVDRGEHRALKARLDDESDAGRARWVNQINSMLARLDKINAAQLPAA